MGGGRDLLKKSFDYKRVDAEAWYAPILLLITAIAILPYSQSRKASFLPVTRSRLRQLDICQAQL